MRIATWNVNSLRARLERVLDFMQRREIDVLAMQETKVKDAVFPAEPFHQAGYEVGFWGENQYNGVAIASRVGLADLEYGFAGQPKWGKGEELAREPRAIGATCLGVRVWSLYVPNGRAQDDPHMAYKLDWLAALSRQAANWADDAGAKVMLMGDFNVAPLDSDVWDPAFFAEKTHLSLPERAGLAGLEQAGYREVTREHLSGPHTYTFWDYQALRFPRNEGMRIDFAFATPALADDVAKVTIWRDERKGKGASDHVPVEIELN